jgi:hypothetical protein
MAQQVAIPDAADEVRLLRSVAERVERGEVVLPEQLHEALVRVLEDALDSAATRERQGEPAVPWDKVKASLGL